MTSITKLLIVEGNDDISFVSGIMNKRVKGWIVDKSLGNNDKNKFLVRIEIIATEGATGGKSQINFDNVHRKAKNGATHLGIILDADNSYSQAQIKVNGIIETVKDKYPDIKYGYWIMPNNCKNGMVEDFALSMIKSNVLLKYAKSVARTAKAIPNKAPYRKIHTSKAQIRTWLAWQDEPGMRMGNAIIGDIINAKSPKADSFVNWFSEFFEVEKL